MFTWKKVIQMEHMYYNIADQIDGDKQEEEEEEIDEEL